MGVEDQDLEKTHLGEERRQGEARSHPHCCPELKRCCTRKGSTVKGVQQKPPCFRGAQRSTCNSKAQQKDGSQNKTPPQTLGPSLPGMTASGRFWQLRPTGSSTVPSVSWGLSQANLPSTLPPTQDPMVGCSERGGGGQVARWPPPDLICSPRLPAHLQARGLGFPQGTCKHCPLTEVLDVTIK